MEDPRKQAEKRVGQTLNGKFHIDRLLDVGGMAAVYEATHRNGKKVAVKLLHASFASEPQIRERFLREGYVANKIDHAGAVSIIDDDTTPDGAVFIVMELLEGESVEAYLKRVGGRLKIPEVLAIADQVLSVLAVAHARGIVHRDIKPGNLFIAKDGHVKVLDFGLARVRDGKQSIAPTAMGTILGTYQYMPPEQARGKMDKIDGRSDLFGLAAVMFRALTGRYVHDGVSAQDILLKAMREPAPKIVTIVPGIPGAIANVVDRALMFEMDRRYPTAEAMQLAVREAYEAVHGAAAPVGTAQSAAVEEISVAIDPDEPVSVVVEVSFGGVASPAAKK